MTKVAIIQQAPIFLDREKTIQKTVALIEEAAGFAAHRKLDVAGHYARPDIFKLHVNTSFQSPFKLD